MGVGQTLTKISGMEERIMHQEQHPLKRVRISSKRQISIPKEFFDAMHFSDEALIEFTGTSLIIKQVSEEAVDFSSEILKDLVEGRGLSGKELIDEFTRIKQGLPSAINKMTAAAIKESKVHTNTADYMASLLADEG
ncbi:hypothetical protein [Bacillus sp. RS11]|uniref:hypothetical protein n=1 Tax=Lysinibacillus sp. RS11 TaxID=3242682 RepID=UPI001DE8E6A4|nr:hypothetical protein [Salmonella enterica subsp. enterica serovar Enteritidis]